MLTELQRKVLGTIAKLRSPKSYLAGGAVLNVKQPRISDDLDIFHDDDRDVTVTAEKDIEALRSSGFRVSEEIMQYGLAEVVVGLGDEETLIQWMQETSQRFFPLEEDAEFGYRLHDVDLAVNKVVAAATRRAARDIVDLVTIDAHYMKLGPLLWAAASSKTALSPVKMIENIIHNAATQSAATYRMVRSTQTVDGEKIVAVIQEACEEAREFCRNAPIETIGHIFVDAAGKPVSPTLKAIVEGSVRPHPISEHGAWPSFPGHEFPIPGQTAI